MHKQPLHAPRIRPHQWLALASLMVASGCGSDSTAPAVQSAFTGSYVLTLANGQALPTNITPTSFPDFIQSGSMTLSSDGTSKRVVTSSQTATGSGNASTTYGVWHDSAGGIAVHDTSNTVKATWRGDSASGILTLTPPPGAVVYYGFARSP